MPNEIDRTDMAILHLLQENARSVTTEQIAEKIGVTSTTVGKRIREMEERGVIRGYNPTIDYRRAGLDHHYVVICTAPLDDDTAYKREILENVSGVVKVRRFLTAERNLSVELVAFDRSSFEESLRELSDISVDIDRFELIGSEVIRPFDRYGEQFVNE